MALTDGVAGRSVAVGGVGHWGEGVGVGEVSWLGVSAPLAETLGAPGHEGGGGSGVSGNSGQTVPVAVSGVSVGSVVVGGIQVGGVSLGISAPLAVVVAVAVGGVAVGSVAKTVSGVSVGVTVVGISLGLSLSAPLAIEVSGPAAVAGGADSWGAHSGPVGVGVVQSWSIGQVAGVGLGLAGDDGDNGSSNLE